MKLIKKSIAALLISALLICSMQVVAFADDELPLETAAEETAVTEIFDEGIVPKIQKEEIIPEFQKEDTDSELTEEEIDSDQYVISGKCGDNLTYEIRNGVLTVSGTGDMWNYDYDNGSDGLFLPGWKDYKHIITKVVVEEGVTDIGDYAFDNCYNLTVIVLPEVLETIGESAFADCVKLTEIDLPENLEAIDECAFSSCNSLTEITFPSGLKEISAYTFSYCQNLATVNLAEGLETICTGAFLDCENLTEITFSSGLKEIGMKAFDKCSNLVVIDLPEGLETIGDSAFSDTGLVGIEIPSSVSSIGECIFENCPVLESITVAEGNAVYDSREGCNAIIKTKSNTLITGCKTTVIPESVTGLDRYAFGGCTGLTEITLPKNVKSIGFCAFSDCTNLVEITLPEKLKYIGAYAFENTSITDIIIPKNVINIEFGIFAMCDNLTSVTVASGNKVYDSREGCNAIIETETNTLTAGCKGTTIPDSISAIGSGAFEFQNITNICIPKNVEEIESYAFYCCENLRSVTFAEDSKLTSLGEGAFAQTSITEISLPEKITVLEYRTFEYCPDLTSVVLPTALTEIGASVFTGCTSLTSIDIPARVTTIGEGAFFGTGLTSITLPGEITSIGCDAFYSNTYYWGEGFDDAVLTDVYYAGNAADRSKLTIGEGNDNLLDAEWHYGIGVPARVTMKSAAAASNGITVKWNHAAGATSYRVYRKTAGGSWTRIAKSVTSLSYTDKTAKTGTVYYYKVLAYNGHSKVCGRSSATAVKGLWLNVVDAPVLSVKAGRIAVKWNQVDNADAYAIYRKGPDGKWKIVKRVAQSSSKTVRSWNDTSVTAGTEYTYFVRPYRIVSGTRMYGAYDKSGTTATAK